MWCRDLADADASCGGKAANLARLIPTLLVPPGFVIEAAAFQSLLGAIDPGVAEIGHVLVDAAARIATAPVPDELVREVRDRAAALGPLVAVRSSATLEDGAAGAAAGVFSSRRTVPIAEVWDAIRAVWTSVLTPLAATYARRRGGPIAICVIVQRFVEGGLATIYTRPPGAPDADEILIQRDATAERAAVSLVNALFGTHHAPQPHLERFTRARLPAEVSTRAAVEAALRAEAAIAAPGGADVELVQTWSDIGEVTTFVVQARPIVHPSPWRRAPVPPALVAPLVADGRVWTWDVAHNPDPLSVAQRQLVERVDGAGRAPFALRVCAGYLYSTPLAREPCAITDAALLAEAVIVLEARLAKILDEDQPIPVIAETAGAVARVPTVDVTTQPIGIGVAIVEAAVERFVAFYRVWAGELSPLVADARRVLPDALRARGIAEPEALAAKLVGRHHAAIDAMLVDVALGTIDEATLVARLGVMAPAWDVCVPTFAERPALVREAVQRCVVAARSAPQGMRGSIEPAALELDVARELAIARVAADLAERDDLWFARAQWLVRRALLSRARAAGLPDADIFWLSFDAVLDDLADARRRASGARAAAERAAHWDMPVVVNGPPAPHRTALRGVGTGPRVRGSVVRFASLASAVMVGHGDVIVVRAVTPALAVLVVGCAALVSETGGLLDHGAALARELGIPCVVGCHDAWSVLADGMVVTVDGDAGTVETTGTYSSSSS